MKNILLIAQSGRDYTDDELIDFIKCLLADGKYQIVMLVVTHGANKKAFLSIPGVCRVMDSLEMEYQESMEGIDFETIELCRDMQMNIEGTFYRLNGDYQLDKYQYYAGLSFWNSFFKKNQVDIVLQSQPFHGWTHECCDLIARMNGIKFFHINVVGYHNSFAFYTAKKINRFQLIPMFSHPCQNISFLLDCNFDKTKNPPTKIHKSLIRKFLYRIGGNLFLKYSRSKRSMRSDPCHN